MALLVNDERLTTRVGAAVLGVTLAAIVFVVAVYDRMEGDGAEIRVYFSSVTAITEGASENHRITADIVVSLRASRRRPRRSVARNSAPSR